MCESKLEKPTKYLHVSGIPLCNPSLRASHKRLMHFTAKVNLYFCLDFVALLRLFLVSRFKLIIAFQIIICEIETILHFFYYLFTEFL